MIAALTKHDKIIIAVLLLLTAAGWIWMLVYQSSPAVGSYAVIRQGNTVIKQVVISNDDKPLNIDFAFEGGTGTLQVQNGRVRLLPMPADICLQGICSETGWVDSINQLIACVPNRLTVSIVGAASLEVDSVAY